MSTISNEFEVQQPKSSYVRLTAGKHHIRILGPSISGYEAWVDTPEGGRKPIRTRIGEGIPVEHADDVKKFLAWPVWNYDQSRIQVFEVTQRSIQIELMNLERNKKWGDLQDFDIEIERTGEKLNSRYAVRPEPKTELDEEIVKAVSDNGLPQLEALFEGQDPFTWNEEATETLNPKEVENLPF